MLIAHSKIFINVCASGALSGSCLEIREWQVMLSVHAEITWCLRMGVNRQWVDQWTDEKIFMVTFSCVVPSFWQPPVVMNSCSRAWPFLKEMWEPGFLHASIKRAKVDLWLVATKRNGRKQKSIENRKMRKRRIWRMEIEIWIPKKNSTVQAHVKIASYE